MRSIRCTSSGIQIESDTPRPSAPEGEVLIKIRMAGICRTDLELTRGYMRFNGILGHEFVGEIAESNGHFDIGQRVVGEINVGCGACEDCRRGFERHCRHRSVLGIYNRDGCMADYIALPVRNIYPVPDTIPDEAAVFTEPLAAALEIFEQIHIEPSHRVCIIGDGKLGLLTALAVSHKHEGERLLIGHHREKLNAVNDRIPVCVEQEIDASRRNAWDIVIEATGSSKGLEQAIGLVRPRGTIVLKSTMAQSEPLDLTPIVIHEIDLIGSRCGRFQPALALLARGVIPVERLIEAIYPFDAIDDAWQRASAPGSKKVLLSMIGQ